jgi:putative oxidoreductase
MVETDVAGVASIGLLILRFELAAIFWSHGWPKLNPNSPMKGPQGFSAFLQQMKVPSPLVAAWLVALLETLGPMLLVLGLFVRPLGLLFAVDMFMAVVLARKQAGFTSAQGVGWEYEFALLCQGLALLFLGGGAIAL